MNPELILKKLDKGYVWVVGDLKQAESMVCAWRGPIPLMKQWYKEGVDTHLGTAKLIGKVIQEQKLTMPRRPGGSPGIFMTTPWQEFTKKNNDDERDIGKKSNHANNYGLGPVKFAQIASLPLQTAKTLQGIHHLNFPEIRGGYQKWIVDCLQRDRTIHLPPPLKWKKTFYDIYGPELERAGFAFYPQSTVGAICIRGLRLCCEVFKENIPENTICTPKEIRSWGLDVQMQVHDSLCAVVPNSKDAIDFTCRTMRRNMELELVIGDDTLTIPVDFKIGPDLGNLKDYDYE